MATLTVQEISRAAITPSFGAAAGGGDQFANDGRTYVHIKNGGASPITLTVVTQMTVDGKAVADDAITVTNAQERVIGPFPPGIYNDANGMVQLTYSAVTSVTLGTFRLP